MASKEYSKSYYLKNKELLKIKGKIYYFKNKEKRLRQQKEYNKKNKEKIRKYYIAYYNFFRLHYSTYNRVYYQINKDKIIFNRKYLSHQNYSTLQNSFDKTIKNTTLSFD